MSGNTKMVAEIIAKELSADLIEIKPVKDYPDKGARKFIWGGMKAMMGEKPQLNPYEFNGDYDRIIFATPVWASSFTPPIRTFIDEYLFILSQMRTGGGNLVLTSGVGRTFEVYLDYDSYAGGGAEKAIDKLAKFLGIEHFDAQLILVDPKDQPSQENEEKIQAFCGKLNQA